LGVRVPAVLISPYIEKGTIVTDVFDHASLAATARKVLIGAGWEDTFLTQRDHKANTFEAALTRSSPRDAKEVDPTHFHRQVMAAHATSVADRAMAQAAKPLSDHQVALMMTMASAVKTQAQAAGLHEQIKTNLHPTTATAGGGD
jgi:phospholipase C